MILAATIFGSFFLIGPFITAFVGIAEFFIYLTRSNEEFDRVYIKGHKPFF